jgi:hypothetical protein
MFRRTFLCFSLFSLLLAGCGSPFGPILSPIFAIGIAWANGEAHKYYHADQQTVWHGVKNAANDLGFDVVDERSKGNTIHCNVTDRSTSANRFKIRVIIVQPNVTKLSIRVNTMGDKEYAELIYRKVDKYPGIKTFKTVEELEAAYHGEKINGRRM